LELLPGPPTATGTLTDHGPRREQLVSPHRTRAAWFSPATPIIIRQCSKFCITPFLHNIPVAYALCRGPMETPRRPYGRPRRVSRLRAARQAAGLSLRQVARLAGVTAGYLGALERLGSAALTYARARRLAEVLGCSLTDLLDATRTASSQAPSTHHPDTPPQEHDPGALSSRTRA
jgi:hypothetical protein